MVPDLHLGGWSVPTYLVVVAAAFGAAGVWARRQGAVEGWSLSSLDAVLVVTALAALLGARALHVVVDGHLGDYLALCLDPLRLDGTVLPSGAPCVSDDECAALTLGAHCSPTDGRCRPARDCLRAFAFWRGGMTLYGGVLVGLVTAWVLARRRGLEARRVLDVCAIAAALGIAIGRFGCHLTGCCFGRPGAVALGLRFPAGSPPWVAHVEEGLVSATHAFSLPVVPTQLIEALVAALLFGALSLTLRLRRPAPGLVACGFIALYGVARAVVECWRADERGLWMGDRLSTAQVIALITVPVALAVARRWSTPTASR